MGGFRESYTLPRQANRPIDYRRTKGENQPCNRTTTSCGQNVLGRHESDYSGMAKDPNRLFFRPGASSTSLQANGSDVWIDRKSTRLNSSHANISYAVFCLKKTKQNTRQGHQRPQYRRGGLPTSSHTMC